MTSAKRFRSIQVTNQHNYCELVLANICIHVKGSNTGVCIIARKPERCNGQREDLEANVSVMESLCAKAACLLRYTSKSHVGNTPNDICMVTRNLSAVLTSLASGHQPSMVPFSPRRPSIGHSDGRRLEIGGHFSDWHFFSYLMVVLCLRGRNLGVVITNSVRSVSVRLIVGHLPGDPWGTRRSDTVRWKVVFRSKLLDPAKKKGSANKSL